MQTPAKNLALTAAAVILSLFCAEEVTRIIDRQPLFAMPLAAGTPEVATALPRDVPLAAGVSPDWFFESPPPLPNRRAPPAEWTRDAKRMPATAIETPDGVILAADLFKAWNSTYAGDACRHRLLSHMPTRRLYMFDSPDASPRPRYRYMPNATTPVGLVTNEIGWRGPPLEHKTPTTVRIVFVGASTTAESPELPYSYPELIDHWLKRWARSAHPDIAFQALNAGREGMISTDIAEIVENEVAPMRPDLVVYYEGANQFNLASLTHGGGPSEGKRATLPIERSTWLSELARYSSLAGRLQAALTLAGSRGNGREAPKPDYTLDWPQDLSETDPDLSYPNLPVNLTAILHDLDAMRATLGGIGSEFAVSSFFWLVKDGMVVDPLRGTHIWNMLNRTYWPWRYRDIERLAAFQNRVLRKYAAVRGLPLIDVVRDMPFDPGLFSDAIHTTASGVRVRAWVVLQQLVPLIEDRLARGVWPSGRTDEHWPTFATRELTLECGQ